MGQGEILMTNLTHDKQGREYASVKLTKVGSKVTTDDLIRCELQWRSTCRMAGLSPCYLHKR